MNNDPRAASPPALPPMVRVRIAYRRIRQFLALPGCYRQVRALKECPRSRRGLARDLLVLFFSYKTFPDHYRLCRLWEVEENEWKYYYGSNYHPHQRMRLRAFLRRGDYRMVTADKFLCAMYCKGVGIPGPETYGVIDPADDFRSRIRDWLQGSPAQALIVKPLWGLGGAGIVIARKSDDGVVVQGPGAPQPLDEFVLKERSIVQEVLLQDPRMAVFSPTSVNTVRIVTMLTRSGGVLIVNALMRSGVGTAFVDNWSAGGVAIGVDCDSGKLRRYAYDKESVRYERHPTTGIVFWGRLIPEWERLSGAASMIPKAFPFNRLLGLDMAIDQNGRPMLIEINGAPDIVLLEQNTGPLLRNEAVLRAFGEYGLLVNRHQKKLYSDLERETRLKSSGGIP